MTTGGCWKRLGESMRRILDTSLRPWASLHVADGFIGPRCSYIELENGFCGAACSSYDVGEPVTDLSQATPRLLARLVERGGSRGALSLALAAMSAATMAWIYETPNPPITMAEGVGALSLCEEALILAARPGGVVEEAARRGVKHVYMVNLGGSVEKRLETSGARVVEPGSDALKHLLRRAGVVVIDSCLLLHPEVFFNVIQEAKGSKERVLAARCSALHPDLGRELGLTMICGGYLDPSICRNIRWHIAGGGDLHVFEQRRPRHVLIPRIFLRTRSVS